MKHNNFLMSFSLVAFSLILYPLTGISQTQKGNEFNGSTSFEYSGWSISMPDANTIAISSYRFNGQKGTVWVFYWDGGNWQSKGSGIDGEASGDWSGYSVSMPDANTVAIGAPFNDGSATDAGHVRIYSWDGDSWEPKGSEINGEAVGDESGWSVSMPDANTVAIGAPYNNGNGGNSGHVRVYSWDGDSWEPKGSEINGESLNDLSGWSVSMPDANTVAIGARGNDGGGNSSGHVRVYSYSGGSWTKIGQDIDGEAANDESGWSVSMPDATTVAIGSQGNDGGGVDAGHVRVYSYSGSSWTQKGGVGADIDGEAGGDSFGYSVSMSDANNLAIGAPRRDISGNVDIGYVRLYRYSGGAWTKIGNDIVGEDDGDFCGWSVSMPDVSTVGIGAYGNDNGTLNDAGQTRVFDLSSLPVHFGAIGASINNSKLFVSWSTLTETNNSHFVIEASSNGTDFTEIGRMDSKASNGNSSVTIDYSMSIELNDGFSYASLIVFALLGLLFAIAKRNREWMVVGMLVCVVAIVACKKSMNAEIAKSKNLYIRIAQVDKDGGKVYSKVLKVSEPEN